MDKVRVRVGGVCDLLMFPLNLLLLEPVSCQNCVDKVRASLKASVLMLKGLEDNTETKERCDSAGKLS